MRYITVANRLPLNELYRANKVETVALVPNAIYAVVFYMLHTILVIHIGTEQKSNESIIKSNTEFKLSVTEILYLYVIEEYEFPTMKMSTDGNVHVLDSGPFQPATGFFKSLYPPNTSSSVESKEIKKHAIHLLLYFKMEG